MLLLIQTKFSLNYGCFFPFREYQKGCDWEIYVTPLSDMFVNALFCDLSYSLYLKFGVVLFALQVEDLKLENSARLFLNPAEYKIPNKVID